jgi:hypothetical protein
MAGMVWRSRDGASLLDKLPVDPSMVLAGVLILGFGLWLVGTLNLLAARNRAARRMPRKDSEDP